MSEKLVLIDGHSILNRAFYGVPDLTNREGLHTNAVYGFLNIMFKILEEEKPQYLTVAFDVHAPTFRHKIYAAYKGTRKPMPDELREQVPVMKELLLAMNVCIVEQAGLEADDLLGTLANRAQERGMEVSLVSGDRDLLQIASEHIKVRIPKTKGARTEVEDYYAADVKAAYQVTPQGFIDLKALMGDTADNIPGVPKVGQKTATELMVRFGSLANIYAHVDEIEKKSIRESLKENRALADLSKTLATINVHAEFPYDFEQARVGEFYNEQSYKQFQRLGFKQYLARFANAGGAGESAEESCAETVCEFKEVTDISELDKVLAEARAREAVAVAYAGFPADASGMTSGADGQMTLDFTAHEEQLALVLVTDAAHAWLVRTPVFPVLLIRERVGALADGDGNGKLIAFDAKALYPLLAIGNGRTSVDVSGHFFDTKLAAYLLNPLKSDYEPQDVAAEYAGREIKGYAERFGKLPMREAFERKPDEYAAYLRDTAQTGFLAYPKLKKRLADTGMEELFRNVEMPLSYVLCDMEEAGIRIRPEELKTYGDTLAERIGVLEQQIYEQAGETFNINSPKQLGEILFDKLHMKGGKKTKTGYSTAADVLEKLAEDHPIVKDVLEYRGLAKLKSTYADGLGGCVDENDRIHTTFNQTITATGRISSTEPNLQNIPMRTELGRLIRKCFIPKDGYLFMDADYSQIELRILAHMSGDDELIEAYHQEQDIHRITAAKVFHTPFEEVTDLQRRNAKAVNFGIVYGISSFGLSQDLSISRQEASAYIEQYFETYPSIKAFLDNAVAEAKKRGYSTTMYGRRRPIPELKSSNFMQRQFGERVAMNAPIQGTAADIMKLAMIHVFDRLRTEQLRSRLILQIHDELLIETAPEEEAQVRGILAGEMQRAADLSVALAVDLHTGTNWYEAK
ncbi:MAG: DNA polymerase I [Clostridium sp.]|nr:DNA polymerase I [Clostridium sp.]